jgi:Flp pilus assembly protein TadD
MNRLLPILLLVFVLSAPVLAEEPGVAAGRLNEEGISLVRLGQFEKAIEVFKRARALVPSDATLRKNLAAAHSHLGVKRVAEGKLVEAVKELRAATTLEPTQALYHINLGIALVRSGKDEEALRSFQKAVQADSTSPAAHYELGNAYYRAGNLARAVTSLTRAATLDRTNKDYIAARDRATREYAAEKSHTHEESAHFELSWDGSRDIAVGARILRILEDAWERVGVDLNIYPKKRIRVILYGEKEFRQVTGMHGWVTGLYDGRIRIPVKDFSTAERQILPTLYHEYTHVAVGRITKNCPTWLNEGLAQVYEKRDRREADSRVARAAAAGSLIPLLNLRASFTRISDVEKARLAYAQSLSLTLFIMDEHGPERIGRFLRDLGEGKSEQEAADRAFHRSVDDIYESWKDGL